MHDNTRQRRIYNFIVEHSRTYRGHFPTVRQIMEACGIPSSGVVSNYLTKLERYGLIVKAKNIRMVAGSKWSMTVGPDYAELELAPTEAAPDGAGNAQAPGIRPNLLHSRAVDSVSDGPAWKRLGQAPGFDYCPRCGIALPTGKVNRCENCNLAVRL